MHNQLKYLISLVFLIYPLLAKGQNNNYQTFENIHLSAGASMVGCFVQDSQGLIWVGSDKGLYSYDGYSTQQHYTLGENNNTRIYCGLEIGECYLYLGADNGLLIYNYLTDCYEEKDINFPTDIRALALQNNSLWIGTLEGLYLYNLSTGSLERFNKKDHPGLPHETIYSLLFSEADNRIYLGTYNGLCYYDLLKEQFIEIALPVNLHKNNRFVNVLLEDIEHGCIWIGTEGDLFKYIASSGNTEWIEIFRDNSVKSLAIDPYQHLLVGTDNGLYVYQEEAPLQHIVHDSRNSLSLSNNIIWNIFTDRERNTWLATDFGISLSRFSSDFRYVPIYQITGTGDGNQLYSLLKDSRDNYWLGGSNGLICTPWPNRDTEETVWYKMGSSKYPLSHNRIRHIYEDKDRNLWVATDGGLNRFDYTTRQFVHYNIIDSTGTYNCNWAYHIYEDEKGYLWIASCLGGIFVVDKERLLKKSSGTYKAERNLTTEDGLTGMFISRLVSDQKGNIWAMLYNNGGINKINAQTFEITRVPTDELIGERNFNYIMSDRSGVIWVAYRNGLIRFSEDGEGVELIKLDEFNTSEVLSMIEVNDDIWISKTDGVWVLNKQSRRAQRLKIMNKVFTSQFYDPVYDQLFMGTVNGLGITVPAMLQADEPARPIVLTGLYVNNQPVLSANKDEITKGSIRYSQGLLFRHDQNNVALEISDLPYSLEEKNNFIYRLNGLDNDWNLLKQTTNRITFNNMAPGKYQLMVGKLDASGKPSDTAYLLDIRIMPPWYLTGWAKLLYLLLLASLVVWGINFFRVKRRLQKEKDEKEKLIEQSQVKIDFFTKMSNDLSSPLSLIVGPISKMLLELNDPAEKKQLEEVQHHALQINTFIHQKLEEEVQAKARLEEMTAPKEMEESSPDEQFLVEITRIIEERIADPDLNVNSLCELSGSSNKQLYRRIKQLTGVTPVDYIRLIRMKTAEMLLKQKKYTVAEVMYKVGYSNHSYFSKCFKNEYGKTPRQYMENL